jgi:hypothetical protein
MKAISLAWNLTLDDTDRQAWTDFAKSKVEATRLGRPYALNARQWFTRINWQTQMTPHPGLFAYPPPRSYWPPPDFIATIDLATGEFLFLTGISTPPGSPTNIALYVYTSPPRHHAANVHGSPWRFSGYAVEPDGPSFAGVRLPNTYTWHTGERCFWYAILQDNDLGTISRRGLGYFDVP